MELRRYVTVLRRRWLLIVVTVLLATGAAFVRAPSQELYVASATVLVGPQQFDEGVSGDVLSGFERITTTFARLVPSSPVAADALAEVGLPRSAESVVGATQATVVPDTQLLVVSVTDPDPVVARNLANAMSDAFVERVSDLDPGGEGAIPFAPVYVFERARLPTSPLPTGGLRDIVVAALFGFVAAAGVEFLLEYLDVTLKTAAAVERRLDLPVLGVVPREHLEPGGPRSLLARNGG